jgi:hypothetical protein
MENQEFPTMNFAPALPADGIYQKLLVLGLSQRDVIALSHYTEFPTTPFRSHQLQGVAPTHEHLRRKGVQRNSTGVETFFIPHTLHPVNWIGAVSLSIQLQKTPSKVVFSIPPKISLTP